MRRQYRARGFVAVAALLLTTTACDPNDAAGAGGGASADPSAPVPTASAAPPSDVPEPVESASPTSSTGPSASATATDTEASAGCTGKPTGGKAVNALDTSAAGYLGNGADDAANAVDVGAGCTVVLGGRFSGSLLSGATTLAEGGAGAIVRLDKSGKKLLSAVRVANVVEDLEVRRGDGSIAVATDKGVKVLDAAASKVLWKADGTVSRVAIGASGTVAALGGSSVAVYDEAGKKTATIALAGKTLGDVAVDDASGLVFVTGYRQEGGPCQQVQIAFVYAYDRTGKKKWTRYDYSENELNDLCADSRGDRLAIGRDGKLYLAGETAGGNSIFSTDGTSAKVEAANVKYDKFTEAYNAKDAHLTYIARLDPATGKVQAGQTVVARIDVKGDTTNTIKPRAITADADGRIYVGGVSAYQIDKRAGVTIDGKTLKPYAGGDAWVMVTSPDLKSRKLWVAFTDGGTGEVRGLAVDGGVAAVAARADKSPLYTTKPSWQNETPASAGYTAVFPARS